MPMDLVIIQMEKDLKEAAEVSMGTEITIIDIVSIKSLADQVGKGAPFLLQVGVG